MMNTAFQKKSVPLSSMDKPNRTQKLLLPSHEYLCIYLKTSKLPFSITAEGVPTDNQRCHLDKQGLFLSFAAICGHTHTVGLKSD